MEEKEIIRRFSEIRQRIFPRAFERLGVKGDNLVGAEIGVYKGAHAESLLENLSMKKLYLIDSYCIYDEFDEGKKHYGVDEDTLHVAEREAKERLKRFSDKVIHVRKKSSEALEDIPGELDFVYVDGNHQYEFVREDIENYYPKI